MSEHSRSPRQPKRSAGLGDRSGRRGQGHAGQSRHGGRRAGEARAAGGATASAPTRRPQPPGRASVDVHDPDGVRLQKLLAAAGVGSRRVCEGLIEQGRVTVDGNVVTELGVRIDAKSHVVHVDGERVNVDQDRVYLAFNKPTGVVTTMNDDLGRTSVGDYVGNRTERLFHVGRLDADTEGLLLLTNDGELAHRLQHPSYGILKTYLATVPGPVARDVGRRLRAGIELEDGPVQVDSFKIVDSGPGRALVEVILHEGRKHVVRRMLKAVGHPVQALVRTEVGPIRLGDLRPGRTRALGRAEVAALYKAAGR